MFHFPAVDETRVTLNPIEGAEHDYINANFINVSLKYREFNISVNFVVSFINVNSKLTLTSLMSHFINVSQC